MYHIRFASYENILEIPRPKYVCTEGIIDDELYSSEGEVNKDFSVFVCDIVGLDSEILLYFFEDEDGVRSAFVYLFRCLIVYNFSDDGVQGIGVGDKCAIGHLDSVFQGRIRYRDILYAAVFDSESITDCSLVYNDICVCT